MFEIKKAIIRIDINEYADEMLNHKGHLDCSESTREPNEIISGQEFQTLEDALKEIDNDVYIETDDKNVVITYEYISGHDEVYFSNAVYEGKKYNIDHDSLFSNYCFNAIKKNLEFGDKTLKKIKYPIEQDTELYVWSWFNENGQRLIRVSGSNHSPEGVMCLFKSLKDIDDWWDNQQYNSKP